MAGGTYLRYYNNLPNDEWTGRNVRIDDDLIVKSFDWFLANHGGTGDPNNIVNNTKWYLPEGKMFKEWNTSADGTGTAYAIGSNGPILGDLYAIFEDAVIVPISYLTNDQELTSIANAIRAKGGTSAELEYPDEFISAIEAISTGTNISDTTAVASDVLSGKYFYTAAGTKTQGTILTKTSSDLSASGKTVTVPAGYYASQCTKDVATGSATTPATTISVTPSISLNSTTGVISVSVSGTQSVTPTVSAGHVSSGTAGTITVSGSNTQTIPAWEGGSYGSIISFTIESLPYSVIEGMTWTQWVNSLFNTDGYYVSNDEIKKQDAFQNYSVCNSNQRAVALTDTITASSYRLSVPK